MELGDESEDEPMSTEMVEDIHVSSQSHLSVNSREAHDKIRDCMKQIQMEWKGVLKPTQNMGKGLHKLFKTVVK